MRHHLLPPASAGALLLTLVLLAAPALGPSSPRDSGPWFMAVEQTVPLGNPVEIVVTGPPGGYFALNITAAPFNHSYPVFAFAFKLPLRYGANVSTLNLTLPTTDLGLGAYQVALWNNSTPLIFAPFHMTDPVNGSQIEQNVSTAQIEINSLQLQIQGLAGQLSYAYDLLYLTVGVFISGMVFVCLFEWYRVRKESNRAILKNVASAWHQATRVPGVHMFDREFGDLPSPPPNPDRKYKSAFCETCKASLWTIPEIEMHLKARHNIPDPKVGRDYYEDPETVQLIASYQQFAEKKESTKPLQKARVSAQEITMGELGDG